MQLREHQSRSQQLLLPPGDTILGAGCPSSRIRQIGPMRARPLSARARRPASRRASMPPRRTALRRPALVQSSSRRPLQQALHRSPTTCGCSWSRYAPAGPRHRIARCHQLRIPGSTAAAECLRFSAAFRCAGPAGNRRQCSTKLVPRGTLPSPDTRRRSLRTLFHQPVDIWDRSPAPGRRVASSASADIGRRPATSLESDPGCTEPRPVLAGCSLRSSDEWQSRRCRCGSGVSVGAYGTTGRAPEEDGLEQAGLARAAFGP